MKKKLSNRIETFDKINLDLMTLIERSKWKESIEWFGMCFCDAAILLSPQLSWAHCSAAPDHHQVSGPGDWYRARASESWGILHLTSTRDLLLYIPGAGRETLLRPDHHLCHESCHEWIEQNWTWSMWLSCLVADEGCNELCESFLTMCQVAHILYSVWNLHQY